MNNTKSNSMNMLSVNKTHIHCLIDRFFLDEYALGQCDQPQKNHSMFIDRDKIDE